MPGDADGLTGLFNCAGGGAQVASRRPQSRAPVFLGKPGATRIQRPYRKIVLCCSFRFLDAFCDRHAGARPGFFRTGGRVIRAFAKRWRGRRDMGMPGVRIRNDIIFLARPHEALQFVAGYVIELSLSVDNLFIFLVIFRYFKVPGEHQHKVLFWGDPRSVGDPRSIVIATRREPNPSTLSGSCMHSARS